MPVASSPAGVTVVYVPVIGTGTPPAPARPPCRWCRTPAAPPSPRRPVRRHRAGQRRALRGADPQGGDPAVGHDDAHRSRRRQPGRAEHRVGGHHHHRTGHRWCRRRGPRPGAPTARHSRMPGPSTDRGGIAEHPVHHVEVDEIGPSLATPPGSPAPAIAPGRGRCRLAVHHGTPGSAPP